MSSEKFEFLEDDLNTTLQDLKQKLDQRIHKCFGEERKRILRKAESQIEEANVLIQEMEQETKLAPPTFRMSMVALLRNYRKEVEQINKNIKKQATSGGDRYDNRGFSRNEKLEASQRAKLMHGVQSLNRTSESISRSHQIAAETDAVGTEIIDDLGQQRESLVRTRDRIVSTDANLSKSRKVLRSIVRRVMTDKMILIVIIIVELGALCGVVYLKFFSSGKKT